MQSACSDDASSSSGESWQHELARVSQSGVSPQTFSSDRVLVTAGRDLDHDMEQLTDRLDLPRLLELFRAHERQYVRRYYESTVYYFPRSLDHLNQHQLSDAMIDHFRKGHRHIAVLDANNIVTANIYRTPTSSHVEKWGLDPTETHLLFWHINDDRNVVRLKGIMAVSRPAIIREAFRRMSKLVPRPGNLVNPLDLVFMPPNRLRLLIPLVPKAAEHL